MGSKTSLVVEKDTEKNRVSDNTWLLNDSPTLWASLQAWEGEGTTHWVATSCLGRPLLRLSPEKTAKRPPGSTGQPTHSSCALRCVYLVLYFRLLSFSAWIPIQASRGYSLVHWEVFLKWFIWFQVSDPSSLFTALNTWGPELRYCAPGTPIVLVGCQIDMR